jgi:hypothetical protein
LSLDPGVHPIFSSLRCYSILYIFRPTFDCPRLYDYILYPASPSSRSLDLVPNRLMIFTKTKIIHMAASNLPRPPEKNTKLDIKFESALIGNQFGMDTF